MNIFEALNIDKSFSNHQALNNVSIHVPEGSIYGLLGPNGAGKTTLLRIINRITAPDKGELHFKGRSFLPDDIYRLGYLPEERGLYKKMKVGEQAVYLSRLKGLSKRDAVQKLRYWFEKFEMTHWWDKKIEELSKGMAQKVQFIVTVLHEPELLIFDEPFSGFDPVNASLLKSEVLELRRKGTSIIFSTHDMASVEELCDSITLIDNSKAILEGAVSDLKQQFKANLFEIIYHGDAGIINSRLNGSYTLTQDDQLPDGSRRAMIQITEDKKGNDLISVLVAHLNILSFREVLPSMNEIFIQAVSKNKKA
ncbi:MAG: ATP-binding cassette domain-containing protein [Bacteroidales bacterium]|nr:ATP-binding cassette domain-containing protein [Bacteroidales bacterium]